MSRPRIARLLAFIFLAAFSTISVGAESDTPVADTGVKPWQWTPTARAAARLDPAKRLERLRAYEQQRRASRIVANSMPAVADVIEGDKHPELYFVTELFAHLVRSAFVTLPTVYPHVIRQRTSDLFKEETDWNRFATIVADYAQVLKAEKTSADALDKSAVSAIQSRKAAVEARALRAARHAFGKIRFDRMLYETVPPGMSTTFSMDSDFEKSVAKALEREERANEANYRSSN